VSKLTESDPAERAKALEFEVMLDRVLFGRGAQQVLYSA
jgi:hypothetical protein